MSAELSSLEPRTYPLRAAWPMGVADVLRVKLEHKVRHKVQGTVSDL